MEDLQIRPIEPRDVERVLGIISRHDENDEDTARDFFKNYFDTDANPVDFNQHVVVETEDDLIAVGGFVSNDARDKFWVGFLFVDPYYQGQGIGTRLLEHICNSVRQAGGSRFFVAVDPEDIPNESVRFYEVNGFSRTTSGDPDIADNPDSIIYVKDLNA